VKRESRCRPTENRFRESYTIEALPESQQQHRQLVAGRVLKRDVQIAVCVGSQIDDSPGDSLPLFFSGNAF
jgi:hypothetical protein